MFEAKMSADKDSRLEITLYDDIEGDSWWSVSETSAKYIKSILDENPDVQNIDVYINSYGGEVKEGIAIYTLLKRSSAKITVYVDGFACSIASVIAMAGDKVIMSPTSLMMIHHAWTYTYGNAKELRKMADDLDVIDKSSKQAYLLKTSGKITEEELNALLDAESWLGAEDCIQKGFADEISEFGAPDSKKTAEPDEGNAIENAKSNYEKFRQKCRKSSNKTLFQSLKNKLDKKGE